MKQCSSCGQILSQKITTCPACGSRVVAGISHVDGYKIKAIIHEGHSSVVYKAALPGEPPVSIRLFTEESGVTPGVAQRLEQELNILKTLPAEHFVQHRAIRQSREGLWYRLSEWVHAEDWASIFVSGVLNDPEKSITLFYDIASILELLHKKDHFMPYLILDDVLVRRKKKSRQLKVKINYKLSRFLNARATHHAPMLQKLLDCHPDIINKQAINFKSGIWSLGKLFVEILCADPNIRDFGQKLDTLTGLDPELVTLLRIMLSEDPDFRPQSMTKVVEALARIRDQVINGQGNGLPDPGMGTHKQLAGELKWFKKMVVVLSVLLTAVVGITLFSYYYTLDRQKLEQTAMSGHIESYAGSVAFLMVEYWLKESSQVVYKNNVEGTAFLVDADGYLLTNRHVACPWLDDTTLFQVYAQFSATGKKPVFGHKMYLWFEGEKAFKRLPALSESNELSDAYYLSGAYQSGGRGNLKIAGIPRSSVKTEDRIRSPFKHDFAVLKIDTPPENLVPLPLETQKNASDIQRLSPVIILGFPLGNRTQDDHINTSVTRGHVRRTGREIIQVDSSIYKGNSGGPAINNNGRVIGIASGVVTDQISGYFKISTPLSDFGLILPISTPAAFVSSIKSGLPHWDGVLDFSLESKLEQITQLCVDHEFNQARDLVNEMLITSKDPVLMYTGGILNICAGNLDKAAALFKKILLLEPENTTARFFFYLIQWISENDLPDDLTRPLFTMKWYQENEYLGYLAGVLKQTTGISQPFTDYENQGEKSWRLFIDGLILERQNHLNQAEKRFKESILSADANDWVYFLSFSRLNQIQSSLAQILEDKAGFEKDAERFRKKALETRKATAENLKALAEMINQFESVSTGFEEKTALAEKIIALVPDSKTFFAKIVFFYASLGKWEKTLGLIDVFLSTSGRESALSLSMGLLKGSILDLLGEREKAALYLKNFSKSVKNPWYSTISRYLTGRITEKKLLELAEKQPEKLITAHTALGLRAEAKKNTQKASDHYREALGSYLEDWNEYDLALGRILSLRKPLE